MREFIKSYWQLAKWNKEITLTTSLLSILIFAHPYTYQSPYTLMGFFSIMIGCFIWKRFHWSVGLLVMSGFINATVALSQIGWLTMYDSISKGFVGGSIGFGSFVFALYVLYFSFANLKTLKLLPSFLGGIAIIDTVFVIWQSFYRLPLDRGGFFNNPSMNGCFIAAMYFYMLDYFKRPYLQALLFLATMYALLCTSTTLPTIVFSAVIFAKTFKDNIHNWKSNWMEFVLPGTITFFGFLSILWYFFGAQVAHDSGRLAIWKMSIKYLWNDGHHFWYGYGPGSLCLMLPNIQFQTHYMGGGHIWYWEHNSFMNVFMEGGVISFSALLLVVYSLLRRSWGAGNPFFCTSIGLIVFAMANYPEQLAIPGFSMALFATLIFRGEKEGNAP